VTALQGDRVEFDTETGTRGERDKAVTRHVRPTLNHIVGIPAKQCLARI